MARKIMDGNTAAADMAYAMSDVACIYPITPSSNMAESADEWASEGKLNVFGKQVKVVQMQSEAGAIGAVHGSLLAGAFTTTFTASQGLLLMIPNMFKIAGEQLPMVIHVAARAVASHALSIFGDHSDVMACRQTGFCMIASSSVQESHDLALVSHLASLQTSLPFIHFFDGFRTSHELQAIHTISYEDILKIIPKDKIKEFKNRAFNPLNPKQMGTAQNPDVFFQNRERINPFYDNTYSNVLKAMEDVKKITGRAYKPFMYSGAADAEHVIVAMGSGAEAACATAERLCKKGKKVGAVKIVLYRPFDSAAFLETLPKTVKTISVIDRTKEPGADGEPLYKDVAAAIMQCGRNIKIFRGRYGLGGKEFSASHVTAIFNNAESANPKKEFTVGIDDDVTNLSLTVPAEEIDEDTYMCKFFGFGSDGTVGASKNNIKIIGDYYLDRFVQGFFEYDSKKSGSMTVSHLKVSKNPIRDSAVCSHADLIAIHKQSFLTKFDILQSLKNGGSVIVNCNHDEEPLEEIFPQVFFDTIKEKNARLFVINATRVAEEAGIPGRTNTVMQVAFFRVSSVIPYENLEKILIDTAAKTYAKKGEKIVNANINAIKSSSANLVEIKLKSEKSRVHFDEKTLPTKFCKEIIGPISVMEGNKIPVSKFSAYGSVETSTTAIEKRDIADAIPEWIPKNCIQCGNCVMACPHATLRAVLATEENLKGKPETFETIPALGVKDAQYRIQVSPLDCTGCTICSKICPSKEKALIMKDKTDTRTSEANWEYSRKVKQEKAPFPLTGAKGIQFREPYFEFSGACAGCGETPYIKLITQLFGENMLIANATGCTSIYGGSFPSCPYSKINGCGPVWANSLFEDNAEFGMGMSIAVQKAKEDLQVFVHDNIEKIKDEKIKELLNKFLENSNSLTNEDVENLCALLKNEKSAESKFLLDNKDAFVKKSIWIIGGDGWAYDIGYGGLDHVLASNQNVNILVLDTELYSNTGGQSSKSTPKGSYAKFAAAGKRTKKKNLAAMAMAYSNAYVAQVCIGSNMNQLVSAVKEAEAFNGPSIIIAYAPCINHGYNLGSAHDHMKKAVASGYWSLFRFNPDLEQPLKFDSAEPSIPYLEFLKEENRYQTILKQNPEKAEELFKESEKEAKERIATIKRLGELK